MVWEKSGLKVVYTIKSCLNDAYKFLLSIQLGHVTNSTRRLRYSLDDNQWLNEQVQDHRIKHSICSVGQWQVLVMIPEK